MTDATRIIIIIAYAAVAGVGWWFAFKLRSRWGRSSAARIAVAASFWWFFYHGLQFVDVAANLQTVSYFSRIAHVPTLSVFGWVLWVEWRTERTARAKLARVDVE